MELSDLAFEHNGTMMFFKVRDELGKVSDTVSDRLVIREAFGENTYSLKAEDFNDTGILVDLGANIGAVTMLALTLGAKRVEAYEPENENRDLFVQNVLVLNRAHGVDVHPVAVWGDRKGIEIVPSQGATTSNPDAVKAHKDMAYKVETVTLADVLAEFESVDVLKCDTEGAEYHIFLDPDVNKKARKIVIEFHTTDIEAMGVLLATLSLTHNTQVYGDWKNGGGQIIALRY